MMVKRSGAVGGESGGGACVAPEAPPPLGWRLSCGWPLRERETCERAAVRVGVEEVAARARREARAVLDEQPHLVRLGLGLG